ncbi:MAG: hypothetical protein PWP52_113 [Bacteroidales bacterium]|nr:hypothetical protein [Bacteroidales bacterium]
MTAKHPMKQEYVYSGYKKTSITALRSHWQPVIYVSKLLDANSSQALFLTFFITPLKKLAFSKMHYISYLTKTEQHFIPDAQSFLSV